jgi:hypothetical protein
MPRRQTGQTRMELAEDIANRFHYHKPEGKHLDAHQALRAEYSAFATRVCSIMPECRERSLFLTKLEESGFWAHAGIARVEDIPDDSSG